MLNQNLLLTGDDGYNITKSLRFRSSASAYLNRTFTTSTNNKIWTFSVWCKVSSVSNNIALLGTTDNNLSSGDFSVARFSSGQFQFIDYSSGYRFQFYTSALYRDPSAWYHVVIAVDTTQATSTNRVKIYINGSQITAFAVATYPSQNINTFINSAAATYLGSYYTSGVGPSNPFEGYLAEVRFIDGQQLTPSSFGETSTSTGVWIPKKYTGTYGTNGFYLPFTDVATTSGSNAGLGKDFSGNGNYWTTNNISVTSGSTYDSMKDVPTLTDTDTANYCVLNPLAVANSQPTFSNGNLQISAPSAWSGFIGTLGVSSGKWYWEAVNGNSDSYVGICGSNLQFGQLNPQAESGNIVYYGGTGEKRVDGAMTSYGTSYSTETIGVALDIDGGTVTFYRNNTSQGSISLSSSTLNGKTIFPFFVKYASTATVNFGQRPFAYTPPTGFVALNTFNLPTPTIGATASTQANKYMDILTWTGTSTASARTFTGLNFQPDFVWSKLRSVGGSHQLYDAVRGTAKRISSNLTDAETTNPANGYISAFNSNGFATTAGSTDNGWWNELNSTYVAWNWKANGSGSTNTAGSITSTVSANTTAGFSIVTYTGNGSNSTIGHGLGVAPSFIIAKARNSAQRWTVYTAALGNGYYGYLNETFAFDTANASLRWNTAPTSSVFGVGTSVDVNNNTTTYVAYCFAEVAGYSKFGSYTGNGSSDGVFVFTGFRPRYVIVKCSSTGTTNWVQHDTAREPYNLATVSLYPNLSNAETTAASQSMDILSNGFKLRNTSGDVNASGSTYIYMAFAENPFKYSLAR